MIVPAITLALALTVALGFWFMCWDIDLRIRFATEQIRYRARLQARQPYPSKADYRECLRVAARIEAERLGGEIESQTQQLAERLATDPFVRDADRAHNMLVSALAGSSAGLRVVR